MVLNLSQNVGLAEQMELDVVDLHLLATVFGQQHRVAVLHTQRHVLAGLVTRAGANGDNGALKHLSLRLLRDDQAAGGLRDGLGTLDQHAVEQREELLGDGGLCVL